MTPMMRSLTLLVPCPLCHVGSGEFCVTKSGGRATYQHGVRVAVANKIRRRMAASWREGHAACSHSCTVYEGLGEPCINPYLEAS